MKKNEKGNVLVTVVMLLTFSIILGTGFMVKTMTSREHIVQSIESQQAYFAAQSVLDGICYTLQDVSVAGRVDSFVTAIKDYTRNQGGMASTPNVTFTDVNGDDWACYVEMKEDDSNSDILKIRVTAVGQNGVSENVSAKFKKETVVAGGGNFIDMSGSVDLNGAGNFSGRVPAPHVDCTACDPYGEPISDLTLEQFCALGEIDIQEVRAATGAMTTEDIPCGIYEQKSNGTYDYAASVGATLLNLKKMRHHLVYCKCEGIFCPGAVTVWFSGSGGYFLDVYALRSSITIQSGVHTDVELDFSIHDSLGALHTTTHGSGFHFKNLGATGDGMTNNIVYEKLGYISKGAY